MDTDEDSEVDRLNSADGVVSSSVSIGEGEIIGVIIVRLGKGGGVGIAMGGICKLRYCFENDARCDVINIAKKSVIEIKTPITMTNNTFPFCSVFIFSLI